MPTMMRKFDLLKEVRKNLHKHHSGRYSSNKQQTKPKQFTMNATIFLAVGIFSIICAESGKLESEIAGASSVLQFAADSGDKCKVDQGEECAAMKNRHAV